MPSQQVSITIAQPAHLVDIDAARLQIAKVVNAGATNSHGVRIDHIGPVTNDPTQTRIIGTVVT